MNIYVVTEGITETIVYRKWIPIINPTLRPVELITDVTDNQFFIVSANGYPNYFGVIERAIDDVCTHDAFDRLVICVDSDNMTRHGKFAEISGFLAGFKCRVSIRIVVQHFCIETWALGNRKIVRPRPSNPKLKEYKAMFDVRVRDPELLPDNPAEELNRAQFAERYLRMALNDKWRNLTYTKSNPQPLLHPTYFEQLQRRLAEKGHICSFQDLLDAFS